MQAAKNAAKLVRSLSQGLRDIVDGAPHGSARRDAWYDIYSIGEMVCGVSEQQWKQEEQEQVQKASVIASGLASTGNGIPDDPTFSLVHALQPLLDDLTPGDFLMSTFGNDIMMQVRGAIIVAAYGKR